MKILITGASGFLGRNICAKFVHNEHEVYGLSRHNIKIDPSIVSIECDLKNKSRVEEIISSTMPDVIIHCAWDGGNAYNDTNSPVQFQNVLFTVDLMDVIKKYNIPYFVGIGTASEYGNITELICETDKETPTNLYGTCKKMAKEYTKVFCENQGIKWLWIRPFYTYGYNDIPTRLIPKVINSCVNKIPLKLNSCNSYTDYLYIDDFTDGLLKLVNQKKDGIFNICSGTPYYMKTIVKFISEKTNYDGIEFDPTMDRCKTPSKLYGSNEKLKSAGWNQTTSIYDGLRLTIEQYK